MGIWGSHHCPSITIGSLEQSSAPGGSAALFLEGMCRFHSVCFPSLSYFHMKAGNDTSVPHRPHKEGVIGSEVAGAAKGRKIGNNKQVQEDNK